MPWDPPYYSSLIRAERYVASETLTFGEQGGSKDVLRAF